MKVFTEKEAEEIAARACSKLEEKFHVWASAYTETTHKLMREEFATMQSRLAKLDAEVGVLVGAEAEKGQAIASLAERRERRLPPPLPAKRKRA